jgi:hypothetical protein
MKREDEMRLNQALFAVMAAAILAGPAEAQAPYVDQSYETRRETEIAAARLRLATRPAAAGVQELNEAENLLRRLRQTRETEARRKIAVQLDLAVTRLNLVANDP